MPLNFQFQPIDPSQYSMQQGKIWSDVIGGISRTAAKGYESYKLKANASELANKLIGELTEKVGETKDSELIGVVNKSKTRLLSYTPEQREQAIANFVANVDIYQTRKKQLKSKYGEDKPDLTGLPMPSLDYHLTPDIYMKIGSNITDYSQNIANDKATKKAISVYNGKDSGAAIGRSAVLEGADTKTGVALVKLGEEPLDSARLREVGLGFSRIEADKWKQITQDSAANQNRLQQLLLQKNKLEIAIKKSKTSGVSVEQLLSGSDMGAISEETGTINNLDAINRAIASVTNANKYYSSMGQKRAKKKSFEDANAESYKELGLSEQPIGKTYDPSTVTEPITKDPFGTAAEPDD